jgi:putative CRISPR-associated protein (TIGR02619 family)
MTLFICTAGTSIAGGAIRDAETAEAYQKRIGKKIADDRAASARAKDFLIRVSAELNALVRSRCGGDDEVVYLASETEDGRLCVERLVTLTRAELGSRARSLTVEGLQVRDGSRFRQVGVRNLFDQIDRLRRNTSEAVVELNATGGFKGMVPYLTLYGMFHDLPVSYIFEQSDTLIRLPRIPLAFDWRQLAPAAKAVLALAADWRPEHELRALLPADYWDPAAKADYDCLFEHDDGYVGLSAIGLLMKDKLEGASAGTEVLLSLRAKAALDGAEQEVHSHYEFMLDRVRIPLLREAGRHAESLRKTDLLVWKRYGQAGPRMLYWVKGPRVMVGELLRHDEYVAYVNGNPRRRSDYDDDDFSSWSAPRAIDWEGVIGDLLDDRDAGEQAVAETLPRYPTHQSIFLNLSNHPAATWDAAQRAAALKLAPEIRDWRFPEVPPEAGVAEIAARADEIVEQLTREYLGVTHAMVQGEFTLAHMLVRRLQERGVVCLAATTRREVLDDGGGVKTTRFEFVRFREYG